MNHSLELNRELKNYKMVDIFKYIAAIMVICIHCNQIFPQMYLNYFLKSVIFRMAVPFFFLSSAFFIRKRCHEHPGYMRKYIKTSGKSYLFWSIIFIPLGLDWLHQNAAFSNDLIPFALVFGLLHVGIYYHLWYVPAMIFSAFGIDKLLKYFSYKTLFVLTLFFFLFGSIETYYSLLPLGSFKDFFDVVIEIFFTTRSGLLFGMIFTLMGFFIYDYQEKLKSILKYIPMLTLFFALLLLMEGIFLYNRPRLDMNFLIMLIPFSFCFFLWMLSFPYIPKRDTKVFREYAKYYYFLHPICIVIVEELSKIFLYKDSYYLGTINLLMIFVLTHILSVVVMKIRKPIKYSQILVSALIGIIITSGLINLFNQYKPASLLVKYELVPCVWLLLSFFSCYILTKWQPNLLVKHHLNKDI